MPARKRNATLPHILSVALFQGGPGYAARQRSDIVCHQFEIMTILVTLFVAIQLILGFYALFFIVHPVETTRRNKTIFSPREDPEIKPTREAPVIAVRSSGLYLSQQCGWQ